MSTRPHDAGEERVLRFFTKKQKPFIYRDAPRWRKVLYWFHTISCFMIWVAFVWYIHHMTPLVHTVVDKPVGVIQVPVEYLAQQAVIQQRTQLMETMLTLGWLWNLYLLFCDLIPILPKKMIMLEIQQRLRGNLAVYTIVIAGYMAYMLAQ